MKDHFKVYFSDGREMYAEPGVTFTGTNKITGKSLEYICFTDHRLTGPFLGKKRVMYYFKVNPNTGEILYSDNDSEAEIDMVVETLAGALNCPKKGLACLFALERGGIRKIEV